MVKNYFALILVIMLMMSAGCGSKKATEEKILSNELAPPSDIGLTVEEYVEEFNNVAASRHSILKLRTVIKETEKDGKREVCYYLGDSVGISLESDIATNYVSKIIVVCEPEGFNEKRFVERASVAYIFAIQAASAEFSEQNAMTIIKRLSADLKHKTVSTEYLKFSSVVYNGIMMLSIQAADS